MMTVSSNLRGNFAKIILLICEFLFQELKCRISTMDTLVDEFICPYGPYFVIAPSIKYSRAENACNHCAMKRSLYRIYFIDLKGRGHDMYLDLSHGNDGMINWLAKKASVGRIIISHNGVV